MEVRLQVFNPLVPADVPSSLPVAALRYVLTNRTDQALSVAVCGSLPELHRRGRLADRARSAGAPYFTGGKANRNQFHRGEGVQGIFMKSEGVDPQSTAWGTLALVTTLRERGHLPHRLGHPHRPGAPTCWPSGTISPPMAR